MCIHIFNKLLEKFLPFLPNGNPAINEKILKAARLNMAICNFSGRDPYSIMMVHGVGHIIVFDSI